MGVPMIGPRASGAVTSGVPDHPTFGEASTPRGLRNLSQPVCRWMGFSWSALRLRVRWLQAFLITPAPAVRLPGQPIRQNWPLLPFSPLPVPTWPTVGKGRFQGLGVSEGAAPTAQHAPGARCSHVTRRDCQGHFYTRQRSRTNGTGYTGTFRRNIRHVFLVGE